MYLFWLTVSKANMVDSILPPLDPLLQKFTLFESSRAFYLCGSDKNRSVYKLLTIDRTSGAQIVAREDPANYTRLQMQRRLLDIEVFVSK